MTTNELTLAEVEQLQDLGPTTYQQRVIALFTSGRATPAQWPAMAQAVREMSESTAGALVACIDRSVLARPVPRGAYDRP